MAARPGAAPVVKAGAALRAGAADRAAEVSARPPLGPAAALPALPPAEPTLLERAERLRDDVLRSKLTHPDPWRYTAKARAWGERIQALINEIAEVGQTPALHAAVGKIEAEVEGDADFQKARQLF